VYTYFIEKLQNNRSSLVLFTGNAVITLLSFFILSLLSYLLPIEQFGTYRQLLTLISITVALGSFGFASSVYYFLSTADSPKEKYEHINSARVLIILGAVLSILIIALFKSTFIKEFGNPLFTGLFTLGLFVAFIQIIQTIDLNIMLDAGLLKQYLVNVIGMTLVRIGMFYYLSISQQPLYIYLWIVIITGSLQVLINFIIVQNVFKAEGFRLQVKVIREHIVYALPLGLALFFGVIMNNIDRLVLSHYIKDVKAFAILANGNFEVPVITNLYIAFSTIALPLMIKAYKENDTKELLKVRSNYIRQITPVLFPIVFALIFWSTPVITLLFGKQYVESGIIFAVYSLSLFVRFANHNDIFLISGRTVYIVIIQVAECLINLILNIILIKEYGIIGASIACVMTNFLYFISNSFISSRILKQPFKIIFPWKFLFSCAALSALLLLPYSYFRLNDTGGYWWVLCCLSYLLATGLLFYFLRKKLLANSY
jgi:O-antigen/teichoic acid export membrane protein